MVKPIFKNPQVQQQFENDGFVKIELLTEKNIQDLKSLFRKYFPNPPADFYSSSYENDYLLKKEVSKAIGEIIHPRLDSVFVDYTWFGSAFLTKGNGQRSEMPMHQDWTIVDEKQYIALNIWTPLQSTNAENGTLEVIKGSHKWHSVLRAPTLPFYYEGFQNRLKEKLISIPTKATEAIVLNQAVIHYSKANKTNEIRVAITSGIKTKGAPMIFHYWNKESPNEIELFSEPDDFLIQFTDFHKSIFQRPTLGESMGTKPFKKQEPTEQEIDVLFNSGNAQKHKQSFGKKIAKWFKK